MRVANADTRELWLEGPATDRQPQKTSALTARKSLNIGAPGRNRIHDPLVRRPVGSCRSYRFAPQRGERIGIQFRSSRPTWKCLLPYYCKMVKNLITVDPQIQGGVPVFTGTRVPVKNLFDYLEAGELLDQFLDDASSPLA